MLISEILTIHIAESHGKHAGLGSVITLFSSKPHAPLRFQQTTLYSICHDRDSIRETYTTSSTRSPAFIASTLLAKLGFGQAEILPLPHQACFQRECTVCTPQIKLLTSKLVAQARLQCLNDLTSLFIIDGILTGVVYPLKGFSSACLLLPRRAPLVHYLRHLQAQKFNTKGIW